MTRIIGGLAGSLKLQSPAKSTRPTSDRVRESIFNRLEARDLLADANVLDLYAGTGALGLEAISRGAKSLVLIEKDTKAAKVCSGNIALLAKNNVGEMAVLPTSVQTFLNSSDNRKFDLVFIDPPYEVPNEEVTKNLRDLRSHLEADAIVVLERSSRTGIPTLPEEYVLEDQKNYGDTSVFWIRRA